MVVLATTNHPERLDTAILDRPSRFDRKYNFDLPAVAERLAYVSAWNKELQSEMRAPDEVVSQIVALTEGFSFAYMKELFLSSMMQWMSQPEPKNMSAVMFERVARLREQMSSHAEEPTKSNNDGAEYDD